MPEDLHLPPGDGVALAQDLLDAGRPFHAHEVLEALWKAEPDPARRPVWQALAQVAVGLTHEARGNTAGAQRLVARGRAGLAARTAEPAEVDAAAVVQWADRWLDGDRTARLRIGPLS
jgi:predicted metal-dependent hydrolase